MILKRKYYNTIEELPMLNWLALNKGDFGYLCNPYRKVKITPELKKRWMDLYDEYIKKIGLTPDYIEFLEAMRLHGLAIIKFIENGDSVDRTNMEVAKLRIEEMSSGKVGRFMDFIATIEKYMGMPIDINQISVSKFYSYVKLMSKENG